MTERRNALGATMAELEFAFEALAEMARSGDEAVVLKGAVVRNMLDENNRCDGTLKIVHVFQSDGDVAVVVRIATWRENKESLQLARTNADDVDFTIPEPTW